MSGFALRSNGYWLGSLAYTADISTLFTFSREGGGLAEVKWQMDLPPDFDHPALRNNALVEVMDGGLRVGKAKLTEPGRTEQGLEFVANGLYRDAERFLCFDDAGETTTKADEAIDKAIDYGLQWSRPDSISANAMVTGSVTDGLNTLDTLLTALAVELGKFWWVDADGVVQMASKQTTPTYHLIPGVAYPGVDDTDYATHLFGRYDTGSGLATRTKQDAAASARWGYRQYGVDMTPLGSISTGRVDNRLLGLLERGKARLRFTDRIRVSPSELLTAGGQPASLSSVRGGQVVRVHGLNSYSQWLNGRAYLDFVIGEAAWVNGSDAIDLAPLDFNGKSLSDRMTVRTPKSLNK